MEKNEGGASLRIHWTFSCLVISAILALFQPPSASAAHAVPLIVSIVRQLISLAYYVLLLCVSPYRPVNRHSSCGCASRLRECGSGLNSTSAAAPAARISCRTGGRCIAEMGTDLVLALYEIPRATLPAKRPPSYPTSVCCKPSRISLSPSR